MENFSKGLVLGNQELVKRVQVKLGRKFIRARELFAGSFLFTTRVFERKIAVAVGSNF